MHKEVEVVPASEMTPENYRKHLNKRHVRHTMTKAEHDEIHEEQNQSDFNHTHS
jgi:hypothetical protein